jgi:hypothetical protein
MDFIQLGDTFLRIDSILRVQMYTKSVHNYETEKTDYVPAFHIVTKELQGSMWGEISGSESTNYSYLVNSPEGQAFLGWLQSHTKRLLPSEILDKAKQA